MAVADLLHPAPRARDLSNPATGAYYPWRTFQRVTRLMASRFRHCCAFRVLVVGLALSARPSRLSHAATQQGSGALIGRLIDHETRTPIPGATLPPLGPPRASPREH